MEAQLEEKNQELQRVSHACFSIFLFSSSPSFPFVRIYSAQRRTNFLNPVFDRAHSDWSRCLSLSLSLCQADSLLLTLLPPSLLSASALIFKNLSLSLISLTLPLRRGRGRGWMTNTTSASLTRWTSCCPSPTRGCSSIWRRGWLPWKKRWPPPTTERVSSQRFFKSEMH